MKSTAIPRSNDTTTVTRRNDKPAADAAADAFCADMSVSGAVLLPNSFEKNAEWLRGSAGREPPIDASDLTSPSINESA
jgi:hypothetical protein